MLSFPLVEAQAVAVTTLARLGGDPGGYHPQAALIDGGDGFFYGTTEAGGPPNCGTIYKVGPDGTLTTLYVFTGGSDGANPQAGLVRGTDGSFYGTTSDAGGANAGTIFKITATGVLTTIHSFDAYVNDGIRLNVDGGNPQAALVQGSDGNFYGTTAFGGTEGGGTFFRVTPTGTLTPLLSFDSEFTSGVSPTALVEGNDGSFYSVLTYGGSTFFGIVFQITPMGALTTLYTFAGSNDGGNPTAALVKGRDGNFYGTTATGGSGNMGTAFQITPGGTYTLLHTFDGDTEGEAGTAPLTLGSDGNFYGATGKYGPTGFGAAYRLTPAGTLTVLANFAGADGSGSNANGLLQGIDGNFYGTLQNTGNGTAGTVYSLTPAGTLTTLHLFTAGGRLSDAALTQLPSGAFCGTTQRGGLTDDGTIFEAAATGETATIHSFNYDTDGSSPAVGLVPDGTGVYYGTCAMGGPGGGGVFYEAIFSSLSTASGALAPVRRSEIISEHIPRIIPDTSVVTRAPNPNVVTTGAGEILSNVVFVKDPPAGSGVPPGTIYTTAQEHGDFGGGGILMYPPNGPLSYVYQFGSQPNDGTRPHGIVAGADGNVYGITSGGGTAGMGTVFRYTPGGTETILHSFAGTGDGIDPDGGLTLGQDGNLYGTTTAESYDPTTAITSGFGTIFKITPGGELTTLHTFASDHSEGQAPRAALFQANDGNFYGTTYGGSYSDGTVFSMTPAGTLTTLHNFSRLNGDGIYPHSQLMQASDGNLYGTTELGGTDDSGIIFKVALNSTTGPTDGVPTVTLSAAVPDVTAHSGQIGEFLLTLSSAPTADIKVAYTVKGTGINGTDYGFLKGTAKVKAGKTTKVIKVTPEGDLGGVSKKTVVLVLASGNGYAVGTTGKVKVKILAP